MGLPHLIFSTLSNYSRQCVFALAPIPAYLPQYFTLCNTNDPVLQRRKQLLQPQTTNKTSNNNDNMASNNNVHNTISNINVNTTTNQPVTEGGFSSISIMVLLLSHIFRLQYFFVSAIISTFYQVDDDLRNKSHRIHFDLVMQSFVMIGIQLLLLSAVTRRRRLANKKKVDDYELDDYDNNYYPNTNLLINNDGDNNYESSIKTTISRRGISKSPKKLSLESPRASSKLPSSISEKPFIWVYKPYQHWRWDTVHQHIELIVLFLVLEYFICRYYLYPNNAKGYIQTVKNISVLLESCLALPQMIMNYKRKSTDGLSLLMVIGWVLGDLLKLVYFIASNNPGHNAGTNNAYEVPHNPAEKSSSSDMVAFVIGSIFALVLDSIVVLQLIKWYPTPEFSTLKKRIMHSRVLRVFRYLFFQRSKPSVATSRRFSVEELTP